MRPRLFKILFPYGKWTLILVCIYLFSSCAVTKGLEEGEKLYTGAKVKIEKPEKKVETDELEDDLEAAVATPRPNRKFLWIPWRLWVYQLFMTEKQKGLSHWISTKVGEPPVAYDPQIVEQTVKVLENRAENDGFFMANVKAEPDIGKNKVSIKYTVEAYFPWTINKVTYPEGDSIVSGIPLARLQENTLLTEGKNYSLDLLKQERERIAARLKARGYYFFSPSSLLFIADSTAGTRQVNLRLTVKDEISPKEKIQYRIGRIAIRLQAAGGENRELKDTFPVRENMYILYADEIAGAEAIAGAVIHKPGELYTSFKERRTIEQLQHLNLFKLIKLQFEADPQQDNLLNLTVFLSPSVAHAVEGRVGGFVKSNNYAGPRLEVNWLMRRPFSSAVQWRWGAAFGYQTIVGSSREFAAKNIFEFEAFTNVSVPDVAIPFIHIGESSRQIASTTVELRLGRQSTDIFFGDTLSEVIFGDAGISPTLAFYNLDFSYKFNWRNNRYITHEFMPANFTYHFLTYDSPELEQILQLFLDDVNDPTLVAALSNYFNYSTTYSIAFDSRKRRIRRDMYFFKATGGLNFNRALERPYTIVDLSSLNAYFNTIETDFRYFARYSDRHMLATRLLANVAYPFKKEFSIPPINQYSVGGSNSVRAFSWREIGPGSFEPTEEQEPLKQFLTNGNLRLEANVEFRYKFSNLFEGAVFLDGGNVWLLYPDENRPGGVFSWDKLPEEVALGTGIGLRIDIRFIILRFDYGIALHRPDLPPGERWLPRNWFEDFSWRDDTNLSFNLGYPF